MEGANRGQGRGSHVRVPAAWGDAAGTHGQGSDVVVVGRCRYRTLAQKTRLDSVSTRSEVSAVVRMGLELLVRLESSRRLALLGGGDPEATAGRRLRSEDS